MSHKIIFPEGIELIEYLNRGYAICNECGALMERREDPRGGCDIYTCPSCGWEIDEMEYEYERDEDVDERGDDIPDAVRAVDRIRIANCHASYLTTNKAEEKS
jgi:predicted RNA-binding Zn-ribbon protein involved in translation (DUF1610 family)